MKKPNRTIRKKADSAESGAQLKSLEALFDKLQAKYQELVAAWAAKAIFCSEPGKLAELRAQLGEELSYFETGPGEEQYLYRKDNEYWLAIEFSEVHQGGEWKRTETTVGFPEAQVRRGFIAIPITRAQAVGWLDDNIIEDMIPEEFHADFRGEGRGREAATTDRQLLCALLGLDADANDDVINAAMGKAVSK